MWKVAPRGSDLVVAVGRGAFVVVVEPGARDAGDDDRTLALVLQPPSTTTVNANAPATVDDNRAREQCLPSPTTSV
jgi:hypothetical protein